jgi:hypothetical protein
MRRTLLIATICLAPAFVGCKKSAPPTEACYEHSLKDPDPGVRIKAIKEREQKFGVKK